MPSHKQPQTKPSSPQLNTQWIAGVQDKEALKAHLLNSGDMVALVRLKEMLKDKLIDIKARETSTAVYNTPNWPFLQAHTNGQISILEWVVYDLLPFVTDRTSK